MKYTAYLRQTVQVIKPHVPLIKFRKAHIEQTSITKTPASQSKPTRSGKQRISIDEFCLPARFRRQLLDVNEINAVNNGGAF